MKTSSVLVALAVSLLLSTSSFSQSTEFYDGFDQPLLLEEAGSIRESRSPSWWLNSGARFETVGGVGETLQGELPATDPWRLRYALANPVDTDDGFHPQNVFRLVLRSLWTNYRQGFYFRILETNLSTSPNRNASNGVLLFNRYQDAATLYYAGIRVDGAAVIKKKVGGRYFTLAYYKVLPGAYDPASNPNLLPRNKWIGIKDRITTNTDGSVTIKLYLDSGDGFGWRLVIEARDTGALGGASIRTPGHVGIRTDFMDVQFDRYDVFGQ